MTPIELEAELRRRVDAAADGDRLPPMRMLKLEYGVGQATLQEILLRMAHQGLLRVQVGRGMFVQKPGMAPKGGLSRATVLMLSMRANSHRSQEVARLLEEQLVNAGARCVSRLYDDIEHALEVLRLDGHFDACVLQSTFDIPLGLLAFLRERSTALVIAGTQVAGVDVDAVAADWCSALDGAVDSLVMRGHRHIALVAPRGDVQPLQCVRRHFSSVRRLLHCSDHEMRVVDIDPQLEPGESPVAVWRHALTQLRKPSKDRPTAVIVWGVDSDGNVLAEAIANARIRVPQELSIMVLGHIDVAVEHRERFDVIGSCTADVADALMRQVRLRIDHPHEACGIAYLPVRSALFGSIADAP